MNRFTHILLYLLCFSLSSHIVAQDMIPPQLRCKTGLVVVLPSNGMLEINAEEFDDGSTDNVTASADLLFYFNGDKNFKRYPVNCDTFSFYDARGEYSTMFMVNVEDEAGNVSICGVGLTVQDNKEVCGKAYEVCKGCARLWSTDELLTVAINCKQDSSTCYSLTLDSIQSVSLCKDNDYLKGISTKDLVQIQRHLLAIDRFTHPLQYMAADVNNTGDISVRDVSALRKLILGRESDFQRWGNNSYEFYVKQDSYQLDQLVSTLVFNDLNMCPKFTDFIGVKIGDLAVDSSGLLENSPRSSIELRTESIMNGVFKIEKLYYDGMIDWVGADVIVRLSSPSSEANLIPGSLNFVDDEYFYKKGTFRISWMQKSNIPFDRGQELLSVVVPEDVDVRFFVVALDDDLNEFEGEVESNILMDFDDFFVFPNPVEKVEYFTSISKNSGSKCSFILLNIKGEILQMKLSNDGCNKIEWSTSDLMPGIYFIKRVSDGVLRKVIVF